MKAVSEMSVSELLLADRETGNVLDAAHKVDERPFLTILLRRRRQIRAELNRRHDLANDDTAQERENEALVAAHDHSFRD